MIYLIFILTLILGGCLGFIFGLKRALGRLRFKITLNGFKGHLEARTGEKRPLQVVIPKTDAEIEKERSDNLWRRLYNKVFK
jgi:hypothetical protein